ncbi:amphi-Trp domain-containing protein [Haloarchaeobius sp. DFWS5]|uniref:amphi-Trp domain-containing protein n=1 Tax=Haloarchaeobius sp. DFWS5 TaxID=3446114 RepID=UPI003EBB6B14
MGEKARATTLLSRSELADTLRELADQFEMERDTVTVPIANETMTVRPQGRVGYEVAIVEGQSTPDGPTETLALELSSAG